MSNEINLKKSVKNEMDNSFLSVFSDEYIKTIVSEYNKILGYNFNAIELNRISNDLIKDSNELDELQELNKKYATGNYICVVDNKFGPKGYFIKENNEFKSNWNYTLINKKHEEVLKAFLEDSTIKIFTDAYSDYSHEYYELADYFPNQNFIEFYNENYNYKV